MLDTPEVSGPINEETVGLTSLVKYRENLSVGAEKAPELRHTDEWPIDLNTVGAAILGWYGAENFLLPEPGKSHEAIDIFCPEGTQVKAPADGYVVYVDQNPGWHTTQETTGHMVDLIFLTNSGIAYTMVHLDKRGLREGAGEFHGANGKPVFCESGSKIAQIARWSESIESLEERGVISRISDEMRNAYRENGWNFGPHLHLAVHKVGGVEYENGVPWISSRSELVEAEGLFNPLLSLKYLGSELG